MYDNNSNNNNNNNGDPSDFDPELGQIAMEVTSCILLHPNWTEVLLLTFCFRDVLCQFS
jgi:hypothetical protein